MPEIATEDFTVNRPGLQGFVTTAPTALAAPFTVVCPGFSPDHAFEIRRWSARGITVPAVGDEVLVVFDDDEEPWVASWWPATGDLAIPRDYGLVEALPGGTIAKGSRCTFKAATGVWWELVYTGEATYPWAKIGGPPLLSPAASVSAATNTTPSTTGAPSLTAPLAMEFGGFFGCQWMQQTAAGVASGVLGLNVAGVAKLETAAIGGNQFETYPALREITPALTAAKAATIQTYYFVQTAVVPWTFASMYISIDPTRVG